MLMEKCTRVIGRITLCIDLGNTRSLMEQYTRVIGSMTNIMDGGK